MYVTVLRSVLGWPDTKNIPNAPTNKGIVIHYDGGSRNLTAKEHPACLDYWKWCRDFHIKTNGWKDIGYSYGICPHGVLFEGRGFGREQAAQPGGNRDWLSVTLMLGKKESPTEKQIAAFNEFRTKLVRTKKIAEAVSFHSMFFATDCPGDIVRNKIAHGEFSKLLPVADADQYWSALQELPLLNDLGPNAKAVVKSMQRALNLDDDGDIGPNTWSAIIKKVLK